MQNPKGNVNTTFVVAVSLSIFAIGTWFLINDAHPSNPTGNAQNTAQVGEELNEETLFKVTINRPSGPPRVGTGQFDADQREITVACSTCHSVRPPHFENRTADDLDEFHGGLTFTHGTLTCVSCHNPNDYDTLKLADGRSIEFTDVMTLCAQCHGPQMRDYENGAHGGMTGYWDLKRGPRSRNNCVDCHDPHSPQFPRMHPTFKPRDRFLEPVSDGKKAHE